MLAGKKILLGITGSIASYKAAFLIRNLSKAGAQVQVVATPQALDFITPLTLSTLSGNPVLHRFTDDPDAGTWNNHVQLGLWADLMLIAPASANTLAKMVHGQADNLLLATYLSAKCPVYFAPAMDLDMFRHESTTENIRELQSRGNVLIDAEEGELASGLSGKGRMAEPENIQEFLENDLQKKAPLYGKTALVTAGPTYEPIDPVRFLGNRSSGKMGFAIAQSLADQGATVILVSGPVGLSTPSGKVKRIDVETTAQMKEACDQEFPDCNIAVLTAAVSDFRPGSAEGQKIKKSSGLSSIELVETEDILAGLGKVKRHDQLLVGFALETENAEMNARKKLEKKNMDWIVMNSLSDEGAGFGHDTNKISIIDRQNNVINFELKSKEEVARDIVYRIKETMK